MTDLATKPTPADGAENGADAAEQPPVQWAPTEKKKSRKGLWLGVGIPAGVLVAAGIAIAVASTAVFAPGVQVLGASVALHTPDAAKSAISTHLADLDITVTVDGHTAMVTGRDLGLSTDVDAAVESAFDTHKAWQLGAWNSGDLGSSLSIDQDAADAALRDQLTDAYIAPVNADIVLNDGRYEVVADEPGRGIDTSALASRIESALTSDQAQSLASGAQILAASGGISVTADIVETRAALTTDDAQAAADDINALLAGVDFSIDGAIVDEASANVVAEWFDVSVTDNGTVDVSPDTSAIQAYVAKLPDLVEQEPVDAEVVTNAAGDHLHTITEGRDGFQLDDVDGISQKVTEQLTSLDGTDIALAGSRVEYETVERFRRAVVSISDGRSYFYETVNGGEEQLVKSMPHAVGKPGFETITGEFTIGWQTPMQNLGSCDANGEYVEDDRPFAYCTPNVPYVSYFNGDQAFHGTYWHNNFGPGAAMSHGCVNLTVSDSEWTYYFLQQGTPVSVIS
ncbi:L,D-transpeptidase family protein [Microbacterium amylolyticum]|uniref:Vancomycin resistance protein YoaR n=1 Tax=Microbacterium amylolyticum TaxID=936337 RepID=A0ABS4ZJH5_9MICO|nr:peptidoglycan binding domain-containing protein [Microbacterium amylolyticum]MBP2437437.1 vancomycin resistance protein YoaR [Microbacterium amylolyticum]